MSKFSKVSLFSGLNNLKDISVDTRYSAICGYTDADVARVFAAELPGLDRAEVRRWYKGYNWTGESVYNPFDLLLACDFAGMQTLFTAFFASIPHDGYRNSPIAQYEGYYASIFYSIFYSYFAALGLDIRLEDTTNHSRIDMTVLFHAQVFLFEFKVVELIPEGKALQQLKDKAYADKYRARGEPIHLVGVEFSKESRSVVGFEVALISS